MRTPIPNATELDEDKSRLDLWKESVGKIFKLTTKSYGIRTVVYTQVKAVTETEISGDFDVQVLCAEISARILSGRRAHSSACKEGTIHHNAESVLLPSGFGDECQPREFEKVTAGILTNVTTILDLVMQRDPEDEKIEIPFDLPHLKLTDMEASLVRSSPFLIKDCYLVSPNSCQAAFDAINLDLRRAARNTRLTDACDAIYVAQKNDAVNSLRNKLNAAVLEMGGQSRSNTLTTPATSAPRKQEAPADPKEKSGHGTESPPAKAAVSPGEESAPVSEKEKRITQALRGKPSGVILCWERQNPSSEGVVYRIGDDCGLLKFAGWAHLSGRALSEMEASGPAKKILTFFSGPDALYTGPDRDGLYPLFKL